MEEIDTVFIFNDIQSDYYQIPLSDLEKIKEQEEKEREELQKKSEKEEEKNISEGNLDINDPVEIKVDSEIDVNTAEEISLNRRLLQVKMSKKI